MQSLNNELPPAEPPTEQDFVAHQRRFGVEQPIQVDISEMPTYDDWCDVEYAEKAGQGQESHLGRFFSRGWDSVRSRVANLLPDTKTGNRKLAGSAVMFGVIGTIAMNALIGSAFEGFSGNVKKYLGGNAALQARVSHVEQLTHSDK